MNSIQAFPSLTRQRLFVLALIFALLSAQMLGLGHAIAHGLQQGSMAGPHAEIQRAATQDNLRNNPVDLHHSCAAYEAATVASVLSQVLAPSVVSPFNFSPCAPLVAHVYLPPHTPVFESRAPPRA